MRSAQSPSCSSLLAGSGPAEPFDGLPATAVFHSAFADPAPPPGEPERESLDTRVLCVWDD